MTAQPPQDPYGQDPYGQQQGYGQSYQQGYQQPYSGGYPQQARTPFDLAKFVFIAGYVVLGLYLLWFLYAVFDDNGVDFADRFFSAMTTLGQGIFYAAAVFAIGTWMKKQDTP